MMSLKDHLQRSFPEREWEEGITHHTQPKHQNDHWVTVLEDTEFKSQRTVLECVLRGGTLEVNIVDHKNEEVVYASGVTPSNNDRMFAEQVEESVEAMLEKWETEGRCYE